MGSTSPDKMGIYSIVHIPSGKWYVGATQFFRTRFTDHKRKFRLREFYFPEMQMLWDRDGEQSFNFNILECVEDISELVEKERYWIEKLKHETGFEGFNLRKTPTYSNPISVRPKTTRKQYKDVQIGDRMASSTREVIDIENIDNKIRFTYKIGDREHVCPWVVDGDKYINIIPKS